eukprot:1157169-Pelagomonas_calceolata.AAC.4
MEKKIPIPSPQDPLKMLTKVHTGCSRLPPHTRYLLHTQIQCWKSITYTDGSVMKTTADSPPLVGSDVYKPNKEDHHPSTTTTVHLIQWPWPN